MNKHSRKITNTFVYFMIVFIVFAVFFYCIERTMVDSAKDRYRAVAMNHAASIAASVDKVTHHTFTLSAMITTSRGNTDSFDTLAPMIVHEVKETCNVTLKNVALAPNGKVSKVYPKTGNEKLIGFNFMDKSKAGNKEAIEAYQSGDMVLTNPFKLVQGGTGIGARLPVFISEDDKEKFWGIVTITLDYDDLADSLGLKELTNAGVNYKLSYQTDNKKWKEIDSSDQKVHRPVVYNFNVENLKWRLEISPVNGWYDVAQILIINIFIIIIAVMVTVMRNNRHQIREANRKLTYQAYTDALSGCYTRQYLNSVLVNAQEGGWNDPDLKYSLAIVDIDNFKNVNDTYGHDTGDRIICAVADLMKKRIRTEYGDCVIRYGGDEFVMLFNDITPEMLEEFMQDLIHKTRELRFNGYNDLRLTLSVGVCHYKNPEESTYYNMIKIADAKMYEAKGQGKDQVKT